jgi:hypothetical protein
MLAGWARRGCADDMMHRAFQRTGASVTMHNAILDSRLNLAILKLPPGFFGAV